MRRRDFLVGSGVTLGTATAGCVGVLTDEPVRFEAEQARVPDTISNETGYELVELTDHVIERTVEAAGQSRTVEVVNWQAQYEKTIDLGPLGTYPAAIFTVLTTPQVEVLGRTFNPVAEMSTEELAAQIQNQYEEITSLEPDEEAPITILDEETTQTRFAGEVELEAGLTIDIYLHVSDPVESGDDFVIAAGGYPQRLPDEEGNILTMMENVDHDGQ